MGRLAIKLTNLINFIGQCFLHIGPEIVVNITLD